MYACFSLVAGSSEGDAHACAPVHEMKALHLPLQLYNFQMDDLKMNLGHVAVGLPSASDCLRIIADNICSFDEGR